MKEKDKIPEKVLNKTEINNLLHPEFKTLVRKLNKFKGKIHELSENFNKEVETIRKIQSKRKDTHY